MPQHTTRLCAGVGRLPALVHPAAGGGSDADRLPVTDDTLSLYVGALDDKRQSTVRQIVAPSDWRMSTHAGYAMLLEERPATIKALRGHAKHWGKPEANRPRQAQ